MSSLYVSIDGRPVSDVFTQLADTAFEILKNEGNASTQIVPEIVNNTNKTWRYKTSGTMQGTMQYPQSGGIEPHFARAWTQRSMGLDGSFGWVIFTDDDDNQLFVGYCVYYDGAQAKYLVKYENTNFAGKDNNALLAMIDSEGKTGGYAFEFSGVKVDYSGFEHRQEGVAQSRELRVTLE